MELPVSLRESLVVDLDDFLEALADHPSAEAVSAYLVEQLEVWGEEEGEDEVISDIEDEAALDGSMLEVIEQEMLSDEEFSWTGEDVVSLFEKVCEIEWEDGDDDDDDFDDEDDDDDF